ncbi:MAG: LytR/AlgR family response regulator transcription factor [Arcobacteraceae bacterium]|jgi:two-component system LytT family response regulator
MNKDIKILVVDDEKLASNRIQRLLNELGYENIIICNNPFDALKDVSKNKYDVIFLDISMPQISGLELANSIIEIEPQTFIIFQTAHNEFALEAFKSGGFDYLLKPTSKEDIQKTLEKVSNFSDLTGKNNKRIIGKSGDKIYLIELDDIYFIKADLDEVIIRIKETDVYVKRKIGDLEGLLKNKNFFRIHRSTIINVDKIQSMQSVEQSKLEIYFREIDEIVVSSKDGAKEFREYLDRRSL